ncbi:MAG: hypothetical protein ACFE95_02330 [Candidatus Hodarchaeota archaeon]
MIDISFKLVSFLQDPLGIVYENLFFFLSLGKFDTVIRDDYDTYHYEEFVIVCEEWKDRIEYIENVVPVLSKRFNQIYKFQNNKIVTNRRIFKIYFVIYTAQSTGHLLGFGLRIFTPDSYTSTAFANSPTDRLQKAMYLLSRGILISPHHQIDQIVSQIPI